MLKRVIVLLIIVVLVCALGIGTILIFYYKDNTKEILKESIQEQIYLDMAPQFLLSSDEREFWDAYIAGQEESDISAKDKLLTLQAQKITFEVLSAENGVAEISVKAPNLALMLHSVIDDMELIDPIKTEDVEALLVQALENGDYEIREGTVQIAYTDSKSEGITFSKTTDYLDALYGGLISAYIEALDYISEVEE